MVTVNTAPIAQAVVGGRLVEQNCCLAEANARERTVYAGNMRCLLDGLAKRFSHTANSSAEVSWTVPAGGFFVVVTVPFVVDDSLLERSARDYGVVWTPMRHFYDSDNNDDTCAAVRALRLSCSAVTPAEIDTGLDRLAALVHDELRRVHGTAELL